MALHMGRSCSLAMRDSVHCPMVRENRFTDVGVCWIFLLAVGTEFFFPYTHLGLSVSALIIAGCNNRHRFI